MKKRRGKQLPRQATKKRQPRGGDIGQQEYERQEAWLRGQHDLTMPPRGRKGFTTVAVRFAAGPSISRVFTYKVRTPHPFKPGDPVVVDSRVGMSLAFVVKVDAKPNLDGPFTYRWLRHRVVELHQEPTPDDEARWEIPAFGAEGDA